jgi:hypothetical protein
VDQIIWSIESMIASCRIAVSAGVSPGAAAADWAGPAIDLCMAFRHPSAGAGV